MKQWYTLTTLSLFLAISMTAFSQSPSARQKAKPKGTTSLPYGYYEYLPSNYNAVDKHPVVIFFHGIGEKGDGKVNLKKVLKHGPAKLANNGKDLKFIAITPQHPSGWWNGNTVKIVLDYVKKTYKIDPSRIYVTGVSAGGYSAWAAVQAFPDVIAAAVPISGGGNPGKAKDVKNIPIWAFHNSGDKAVKSINTINMVNAISKVGGKAKMTIYPKKGHDAWTATYNNEQMWNWLLSQRKGSTSPIIKQPNVAPYVSLSQKTITLPTSSTNLTATAGDQDGKIVSYSWSKVSGPSVKLENTASSTLKLSNLVEGTYVIKVTVKDNSDASSSAQAKLIVKKGNTSTNAAPVVSAGDDKTITLPTNSITLTGTATDSDGSVTSRIWTKLAGPSVTMKDEKTSYLKLTNLVEGTYVFKFTGKDNKNATASDEVKVTVNKSTPSTPSNSAPIVNAGKDKTIVLPTNSIIFNPTYSDKDGKVVNGKWTKVSGPSAVLVDTDKPKMKASGLVEGTYVFRVTVWDNKNASSSDDIVVNVKKSGSAVRLADESKTSTKFTLFPNPAREKFFLSGDSQEEIDVQVVIINSQDGKIIQESSLHLNSFNQPEMNINHLQPGVYVVKLITESGETVQRLIKQ